MLDFALTLNTKSHGDSALASTREFCRRKLSFPKEIVTDPRPIAELATLAAEQPAPQTGMSAVTALPNLSLDGVHRDYALKGLLHENLVEQISFSITDPDAEKLEFLATPEAVGRNIADPLVRLRSRPLEVLVIGTIRICEEVVKVVQVKVEPLHEPLLSEGAKTTSTVLCSCTPAHQSSAAASPSQMKKLSISEFKRPTTGGEDKNRSEQTPGYSLETSRPSSLIAVRNALRPWSCIIAPRTTSITASLAEMKAAVSPAANGAIASMASLAVETVKKTPPSRLSSTGFCQSIRSSMRRPHHVLKLIREFPSSGKRASAFAKARRIPAAQTISEEQFAAARAAYIMATRSLVPYHDIVLSSHFFKSDNKLINLFHQGGESIHRSSSRGDHSPIDFELAPRKNLYFIEHDGEALFDGPDTPGDIRGVQISRVDKRRMIEQLNDVGYPSLNGPPIIGEQRSSLIFVLGGEERLGLLFQVLKIGGDDGTPRCHHSTHSTPIRPKTELHKLKMPTITVAVRHLHLVDRDECGCHRQDASDQRLEFFDKRPGRSLGPTNQRRWNYGHEQRHAASNKNCIPTVPRHSIPQAFPACSTVCMAEHFSKGASITFDVATTTVDRLPLSPLEKLMQSNGGKK